MKNKNNTMKHAKRFFERNATLIAKMNLGMVGRSKSFDKAYHHNLLILLEN